MADPTGNPTPTPPPTPPPTTVSSSAVPDAGATDVTQTTPPRTPATTAAPTPAATPAQPTTPSPTAPTTPQGIPASALPRGRATGVHGILAHIALGAMAGLAEATKTAGGAVRQGFSNLAYNSPRAQELRESQQRLAAQKQAMVESQQRMQLAQQENQREALKSMDEHQLNLLNQHAASMQAIKYGLDIQGLKLSNDAEEMKQDAQFYSLISEAAAGNPTLLGPAKKVPHQKQGVGALGATPGEDVMGAEDGKNIGSGDYFPVPTGKSDTPISLGYTSWLKSTVNPQDFTITTAWKIDDKGNAVPVAHQTIPKGSESLYNIALQQLASDTQLATMRDRFNAAQASQEAATKTKLTEAQTAEAGAQAYKATEEGKAAGMMAGIGNPALTGDAYAASLPPMMQDLVHGMLNYQADPQSIGRGKEREALVAATIHADPNAGTPKAWSMSQYNERYNFMKEYGSSTRGAGATKDRINTAIGHLNYLAQAVPYLAQNNVTALNSIANAIGVQTGSSAKVVYDAIALKAASEAAAAMKGGGTSPTNDEIEQQFKLFRASLPPQVQMQQIRAQFSLLQTQVDTLRSHFEQVMGKSPADAGQPIVYTQNQPILAKWLGRTSGPAGGGQQQVPTGATPLYSKSTGQVAGYMLNGKVTRF